MKYMIISDIHGNIKNLCTVLEIFKSEKCDKLILLGDLYNYRSDYYKQDIIDKLNSIGNKIIAVRGNCDYDIDELHFSMPYKYTLDNNIFITHGHLYDIQDLLDLNENIIVSGHTHIAKIEKINNKLFLNPGSISIPRRGDESFIIIDNKKIVLKNLENKVLEEYNI